MWHETLRSPRRWIPPLYSPYGRAIGFLGYYNNLPITRSDGFVVQTGDPDPEGDVHDFFPEGSSEVRKRLQNK